MNAPSYHRSDDAGLPVAIEERSRGQRSVSIALQWMPKCYAMHPSEPKWADVASLLPACLKINIYMCIYTTVQKFGIT